MLNLIVDIGDDKSTAFIIELIAFLFWIECLAKEFIYAIERPRQHWC